MSSSQSFATSILATSIVMAALSAVFVSLRFTSRAVTKLDFFIDDWLIFSAALVSWGLCSVLIYAVQSLGFGQHMSPDMSIEDIDSFLKVVFSFELGFQVTIALSKFSVLAAYWRIFPVKSIKIPVLVVSSMVLAWLLVGFFIVLNSCHPVSMAWDVLAIASHPGQCLNSKLFYLANEIGNIVLDVVVLALPIFWIVRLSISLGQKLLVSGVFLLGAVVTGTSCLRLWQLVVYYNSPTDATDLTYELSGTGIWALIETNLWVIFACLPAVRPLLRALRSKKSKIASNLKRFSFGSSRSRSTSNATYKKRYSTSISLSAKSHSRQTSSDTQTLLNSVINGDNESKNGHSRENSLKAMVDVEESEISRPASVVIADSLSGRHLARGVSPSIHDGARKSIEIQALQHSESRSKMINHIREGRQASLPKNTLTSPFPPVPPVPSTFELARSPPAAATPIPSTKSSLPMTRPRRASSTHSDRSCLDLDAAAEEMATAMDQDDYFNGPHGRNHVHVRNNSYAYGYGYGYAPASTGGYGYTHSRTPDMPLQPYPTTSPYSPHTKKPSSTGKVATAQVQWYRTSARSSSGSVIPKTIHINRRSRSLTRTEKIDSIDATTPPIPITPRDLTAGVIPPQPLFSTPDREWPLVSPPLRSPAQIVAVPNTAMVAENPRVLHGTPVPRRMRRGGATATVVSISQ